MIVPAAHIASAALAVILAQSVAPRACDHTTIATGGTAVAALAGPVTGAWLQNPKSATDQGLMTAEPLYLDEVAAAGTVGNGMTLTLQPGDTFFLPVNSSATVSVDAASSGHKFACERW